MLPASATDNKINKVFTNTKLFSNINLFYPLGIRRNNILGLFFGNNSPIRAFSLRSHPIGKSVLLVGASSDPLKVFNTIIRFIPVFMVYLLRRIVWLPKKGESYNPMHTGSFLDIVHRESYKIVTVRTRGPRHFSLKFPGAITRERVDIAESVHRIKPLKTQNRLFVHRIIITRAKRLIKKG